jgi:hypothetical protein
VSLPVSERTLLLRGLIGGAIAAGYQIDLERRLHLYALSPGLYQMIV